MTTYTHPQQKLLDAAFAHRTCDLSEVEREHSRSATEQLGVAVLVYRDGGWLVEPVESSRYKTGTGSTPDAARRDFVTSNAQQTEV